ncbi:MAG TPA: DUF3108 domain-containing protein [Candidatus Omnitrophota bacterium]|nr:DUF3108 domain-containing protein [Candidatus Omnitrophota bacterium]HRY85980.1 DUF3108 domain-containing protein [Candidatus Omnitrophota bacterium]
MKKIARILFMVFWLIPVAMAQEGEKKFPISEKPPARIFLGEKLTFEIRYLGVPVGDAVSEVKEIVQINGRDAYHIEIHIDSRPVLDWVYKVRDVHHTYIDAEHFHSLRYEKDIHEGNYATHETMEYDQTEHIGRFHSLKDHSRKEMFIPKNVQDQISCGYWFRLQDVKPDSKITVPVNADEKNWDLEVHTHGIQERKAEGVGTFQAIEVEPIVLFEGFFVKRGKIRGWMSMDERRIPLVMKVKVPILGNVSAVLVRYEPGVAS